MQLSKNELSALKIVMNESKESFNGAEYLKLCSKLKSILNANYVSFSNHRFIVYIEYCEKGSNATCKIQSKKSLLKNI